MTETPLVSIIIPTYNRAHLIGETLDSVLTQTYNHWECIIVDDGSSDNTDQVVGTYVDKDTRFRYSQRPEEHLSGGNGARNYGIEVAKGEYIVLFDSDDLMIENHLQVKHDLITSGNYDFAVTRTKYFNYTNENIDKYYNFTTQDITKENYILQIINWLTLDIIIKSDIINGLKFNEILQSGQEYNFFSKLVCITEKGIFKDEVLSLRRYHENSIRTAVAVGTGEFKGSAIKYWFTYTETKRDLDTNIAKSLLSRTYRSVLRLKTKPKEINSFSFWWAILKMFRFNFIVKFLYYHINRYTTRFYFLRRLALNA